MAVKDAWHVVDGSADVREHHRPAQERAEIPAPDLDGAADLGDWPAHSAAWFRASPRWRLRLPRSERSWLSARLACLSWSSMDVTAARYRSARSSWPRAAPSTFRRCLAVVVSG